MGFLWVWNDMRVSKTWQIGHSWLRCWKWIRPSNKTHL